MKQRQIPRPFLPMAQLDAVDGLPPKDQAETAPLLLPENLTALASPHPVMKIPVSQLRCSPYNSRKIRSQTRISHVADSLRELGQKDPLYVYPGTGEEKDFYMVLGGETRRIAALQIGLSELLAQIDTTVNPEDALELTRISSILNDLDQEYDLDKALSVVDLIGRNYSYSQVQSALNLDSKTQAIRLKKLGSLPRRFIDFGKDYPERFTSSLGELIQKAIDSHNEDFAFDLLKKTLQSNMTFRRLTRAIEAGPEVTLREEGKRLRRDSGFDIPIDGAAGGRYDVYKSKTSGLKVLKLYIETPEATAKELNEALTRVLTEFIHNKNE
jgi:hypothetical protein